MLLIVLAWFTMEIRYQRSVAKRMLCNSRLSQMRLMFHNYISSFGAMPPVVEMNEENVPLHSWRMLLLKAGGNDSDSYCYNYDEPWNSTSNNVGYVGTDDFPEFGRFSCPYLTTERGITNYVAIVTESGEWYTSLCDGEVLQDVLLIVCDRFSRIRVSEPNDITLEQARRIFERDDASIDIFGRHLIKPLGLFWSFAQRMLIVRYCTREDLLFLQHLSDYAQRQ